MHHCLSASFDSPTSDVFVTIELPFADLPGPLTAPIRCIARRRAETHLRAPRSSGRLLGRTLSSGPSHVSFRPRLGTASRPCRSADVQPVRVDPTSLSCRSRSALPRGRAFRRRCLPELLRPGENCFSPNTEPPRTRSERSRRNPPRLRSDFALPALARIDPSGSSRARPAAASPAPVTR